MRYGDNKFVISSKNPLVERDNRKNTVDIVMACHFHTTRQPVFDVMTKGDKKSMFQHFFNIFYIHISVLYCFINSEAKTFWGLPATTTNIIKYTAT